MIETSKPSKVVEASAIEKNHLLTLQAIDKIRKQEHEDMQKLQQQVAKMSVDMKGLSEALIGVHEENKKLRSQNETLMLLEKTRNVKMEDYIPKGILKTIREAEGSGTDETVDMKRKIGDVLDKDVNDMVLHMFKLTLDGKVDETRKCLRDLAQANAEVPIAQKQIASDEDVAGTVSSRSVGTTTPPAASVKDTTPPTASVKATTPPTASVKATTPPAASVKDTTAPAGSVKATTPPTGSVKATTPPAASVKDTTAPAGSAGTTIPPLNGLFKKMFASFERD
jgi:hypothetical protein